MNEVEEKLREDILAEIRKGDKIQLRMPALGNKEVEAEIRYIGVLNSLIFKSQYMIVINSFLLKLFFMVKIKNTIILSRFLFFGLGIYIYDERE